MAPEGFEQKVTKETKFLPPVGHGVARAAIGRKFSDSRLISLVCHPSRKERVLVCGKLTAEDATEVRCG
jgi:hypothetical protein